MAPSTIRLALGALKDQTTIGLARVSSSLAPDLDVAIVKVTSHDDEPPSERHIREVLTLTSYSPAYVSAAVSTLSRRLSRTRDWVVALKSLLLLHRLVLDGHPSFPLELRHSSRRGQRLLNLSDFRDEAHSGSWDLSAFVRTFALYLDQKLEFQLFDSPPSARNADRAPTFDRRYSDYYDDRYREEERNQPAKPRTPIRDMTPERILARMRQLQQLLDRFLACRPTGKARYTKLVLVALYPMVKESFQIYADICEMLAVLLDRFFDMEYPDCVKAFESYASAAKQIDELVGFYGWCKEVGLARSSEYPEVQRITDKLLETLEEFLRDKAKRPKSPERGSSVEAPVAADHPEKESPVEDFNEIKALPAPENYGPPPEKKLEEEKKQDTGDLLDLREDTLTADDQGNRLALALFSSGGTGNGSWEAFSSSGGDSNGVTSAWQNPAAEPGKADWELALVETASNLSKQKPALAGGFDPVLLNGMYDQGAVRQHVNAQVTGGSASSLALPLPGLGRNATPVLALPAPDGTVQSIGQDPFAASLSVPPPSYVQMSDIEKKQQFLVQEQQLWQQYSVDGMRGQASLAKISRGYNHVNPATPYGIPQPLNGGGYYYAQY